MSWRPIWMLDHTYLSSFEATVDNIFSSLSSSCLYPSHSPSLPVLLLASYCFNHKGATGNFWWAVAVLLSHCFFPLSSRQPQPEPEQGHNPFRRPPPKSEGMKHMLPQINHCDQSHGCAANHWSEKLWKSSLVPDVPSNDYVVSGAKGNQQTSRNLEQRACQFSTLIKHTQVSQWNDASRAKADILWCLISWKFKSSMNLYY